jgi:hypothetical protein
MWTKEPMCHKGITEWHFLTEGICRACVIGWEDGTATLTIRDMQNERKIEDIGHASVEEALAAADADLCQKGFDTCPIHPAVAVVAP